MFTSKTDAEIIFWDKINYITAIFAPILLYHFGLEFTKLYTKNKKKLLVIGYILAVIFFLLLRTNYFIDDVYKYSWGGHAKAAIAHHPFILYFIFYMCLFFFILYENYKRTKKDPLKNIQIKYLLWGFVIFSIVASPAFLPAYGISIYPFEYLAGVIFVIIAAVGITRHFLFGVRVILTEFLIGIMGLMLFILPFLVETVALKIITLFILLLFCVSSYLLIKATYQEIKRREEIEKLYKELEKLDKAKSEFVSIASHQLRTPLTAIKGYISMMLESDYGNPPEKMKLPLKNIYTSNERLIKLVNDLLNVSRIEAGRIQIKKESFSLQEMINSIIEELKSLTGNKNIYLKLEKLKQKLPNIYADKEKIRQAIVNIIDNAIHYTTKGGINVKIDEHGSKLRVIITDTGEGMTKTELSYLFESFSRGKAGSKLWTEGAGLGLYVTKKFIELNKGKIWAESQGKNKGSTFYIELPIK